MESVVKDLVRMKKSIDKQSKRLLHCTGQNVVHFLRYRELNFNVDT